MDDAPRRPHGLARRVRPPSWRDPRLAVGLVLVLGSAVAGAVLAARADESVPVLAASRTLVPGEPLTPNHVEAVQVRLDAVARAYVPADELLGRDAVPLRVVAAGELLPRDALGSADELATRPVAVPLGGAVPQGVSPGAKVDVWVSEQLGAQGFAAPRLVASAVDVFAVEDTGVGLGAVDGTTVEVLLDVDGVAVVLGALANDDRVDLVLVPGTSPRG